MIYLKKKILWLYQIWLYNYCCRGGQHNFLSATCSFVVYNVYVYETRGQYVCNVSACSYITIKDFQAIEMSEGASGAKHAINAWAHVGLQVSSKSPFPARKSERNMIWMLGINFFKNQWSVAASSFGAIISYVVRLSRFRVPSSVKSLPRPKWYIEMDVGNNWRHRTRVERILIGLDGRIWSYLSSNGSLM